MKLLPSSPYVVFRAKEWNSYCKNNSQKYSDLSSKYKECSNKNKRFNSNKIFKNQYKAESEVQLSFAQAIISF